MVSYKAAGQFMPLLMLRRLVLIPPAKEIISRVSQFLNSFVAAANALKERQ
jgi:hypothetical protein